MMVAVYLAYLFGGFLPSSVNVLWERQIRLRFGYLIETAEIGKGMKILACYPVPVTVKRPKGLKAVV
jgi:hypothetical protein